jgi:hypothetical protein
MSQWVQISNGLGSYENILSLAVNGNNIFAGTQVNGVYISTNNGNSWAQASLNTVRVNSLFVSGNDVFAGTEFYGIRKTTNNGIDWTLVGLENKRILSFVKSGNNFVSGIDHYYGNGGIYVSTNNGINWTQTGLSNHDVLSLAVNGNNIFAGGGFGVYISTNSGLNWVQTALINRSVFSLAINSNNVFAGTGQFGVYLSTNNGGSWIQTALTGSVLSLAASGNYIFAGHNDSGVYLSSNNGANWFKKSQGFGQQITINALLIANNYIFAGVYYQSIWRRSFSEIIGIKNISTEVPSSFSLKQNYPNPFNPVTKVQFGIMKTENIRITVFDVSGKELEEIVNERMQPGTYEVEWSGEKFASGIYFYRMQAGDYVETRKMILIR